MSGPYSSHEQGPYGQSQPMTPPPAPQRPGHHARGRLPLPVLILAIGVPALLVGAVIGVGGTLLLNRPATESAATSSAATPKTILISGTMTLDNGFGAEGLPCSGTGGYSDMREGAQVVITDANSATLAVGSLDAGRRDSAQNCAFPFSLAAPAGHQFYGIEVSHRGRLQYSTAQISQRLQLTLGD